MFLVAEFWDFERLCYLRSNKCEHDSSLSPVEEKKNWIIKICHAANRQVWCRPKGMRSLGCESYREAVWVASRLESRAGMQCIEG